MPGDADIVKVDPVIEHAVRIIIPIQYPMQSCYRGLTCAGVGTGRSRRRSLGCGGIRLFGEELRAAKADLGISSRSEKELVQRLTDGYDATLTSLEARPVLVL